MTDLERVQAALNDGALLHPIDPDIPSSVDLALALGALAGAPNIPTSHAKGIMAKVALGATTPEHLVFVLVDGLGCNLIEALPVDAFLRRHSVAELRPVFPSTTAAALTSIATASWPAQHAVPGWFTHLPDLSPADHPLTATILPFIDRHDGTSLSDLGVSLQAAFPQPTLLDAIAGTLYTYHPESIAGSVYTAYQCGDGVCQGYDSLAQAVEGITGWIAAAHEPTYHYLYIPDVDAAEHRHGHDASAVKDTLTTVQAAIARLAEQLTEHRPAQDWRIVVSADHGVMTIADDHKHTVVPGDPLLEELVVPFSGEPRVPMFHVRPGRAEAFAEKFRERFGEAFALLSIDEVGQLQLFGPEPLTVTARARIGDYVGIALQPAVLLYEPDGIGRLRGFHAGLTPDEMRIPLIVADGRSS